MKWNDDHKYIHDDINHVRSRADETRQDLYELSGKMGMLMEHLKLEFVAESVNGVATRPFIRSKKT